MRHALTLVAAGLRAQCVLVNVQRAHLNQHPTISREQLSVREHMSIFAPTCVRLAYTPVQAETAD